MASDRPKSLSVSPSVDERFRQLAGRMARELNSYGAGRDSRMWIPSQHVTVKTRVRQLIGDPPKGHFEDPKNRAAFWGEIDGLLGAIKPFDDERRQAWLRAVNETVKEHRSKITELLNGTGKKPEEDLDRSATQEWIGFRRFLQESSRALDPDESPELCEFYENMVALTESLIHLWSDPKHSDDGKEKVENLIFEMVQLFDNLRINGNHDNKRKVYQSCIDALKHMMDGGLVLEYFTELLVDEVAEFEKAMAKLPPEEEGEEEDEEEEDDELEDEYGDEEDLEEEEEDEVEEKACVAPRGYGPIARLEGGIELATIKQSIDEFSAIIDKEMDSDRMRRLFRHNAHEFMDAMAQVMEDLIQERSGSILGERLHDHLGKSRKAAFFTSIADIIVRKIGWPTLVAARKYSSDRPFYQVLQNHRNDFSQTCFEGSALLTLSAITGQKGREIHDILQRDPTARQMIRKQMAQIDLRSFRERGNEDDLEGGTDHDFIMNEVDFLIRCLECGYDEKDFEEAVPEAVFAASQVPEMVQALNAKLVTLEDRCAQLTAERENTQAEIACIDSEMAAEQALEKCVEQEAELKAEMPDFESEEFAVWAETCITLGAQMSRLQNTIALKQQGVYGEVQLKDEKAVFEERLKKMDHDLQEARKEMASIQEKLQKVGRICLR